MAVSDKIWPEIYTNPHTLRIYIKKEVRKSGCRYKIGIHRSEEYMYRSLVESKRPLSIMSREAAVLSIRTVLEMAVRKSLESKTEGGNGADVLTQPMVDKIIELFKENSLVDTSEGLLMSA